MFDRVSKMSLLPLLMPVAAMKSRRNETEQTHLSFSMPPSFRSEIVQNVEKRVLYKILSDSKSSRGALGCYR